MGLVAAGLLIVKHRNTLWASTRDRQRKIFGRYAAGAFERLQNSFWIGFVGLFAIAAGVVLLVRYVIVVLI
nr:hypothetical protein [Microbacterium hydrocarbonoxydans]